MMNATIRALAILALLLIAASAFANEYPRCKNCPKPRPHYDTQEVIHSTKDVDRSRVINTQTVVPVSRKVKVHNHLVIRKNTIRNIGVVRHNHTIIEKEIRWKRRVPAPPIVVNYVTQDYIVTHRPATILIDAPIIYPKRKRYPLRVRG
jgi:hypothetical protein